MRDGYEPRWLRVVALVPVLAIASFGAVGLFLADLGRYRAVVVLVAGSVLFAGLCLCARPVWRKQAGEGPVVSSVWAAAAVGVALAYATWNGANSSEHVQINRDGGLYLNTGRWLAAHGSLVVRPLVGPFASSDAVVHTSNGIDVHRGGLEFSLSHMLPALLAEAQNLGGDRLMFLTVPVLSGLAILAFFVLAARVIRSAPIALAAAVCLAVVMPQISFSRDSTSEVPTQVLVFTAAWLLCSSATWRYRRTALCAGLVLGLVQPLHVDGLAYMLGLPFVCAAAWFDARADESRFRPGVLLWMGVGLISGVSLGAFDLVLRDHGYLSTVRGEVVSLAGALILTIAVAFVVVLCSQRDRVKGLVARVREPTSVGAGISVLVLGFGAWSLRPVLQETHGKANGTVAFVQTLGNLQVDATRSYAELTVRWITWYLGPLTLTLAILAAAGGVRLLVKGSLHFAAKVAAFMLAPPALLYLWHPRITPDHIWAMRRFLPAVFPAVILVVFAAIHLIAEGSGGASGRVRKAIAIALGVYAIGYPVWASRSVLQMTEERGEYAAVEAGCDLLGPRSAAVILEDSSTFVHLNDPQTLRSFCNIPVAVMLGKPKPSVLRDLARGWKADGRELFVVSESPATIEQAFPGIGVRATPLATNRHLLNYTLLWRPSYYTSESLRFAVAPVPTR